MSDDSGLTDATAAVLLSMTDDLATILSAQAGLLNLARKVVGLVLTIQRDVRNLDKRVKAIQQGQYYAGLRNIAYSRNEPSNKERYLRLAIENFNQAAGNLKAPIDALRLRSQAEFLAGLCHDAIKEPNAALLDYWSAIDTGVNYELEAADTYSVKYLPDLVNPQRRKLLEYHTTFIYPLAAILDIRKGNHSEMQMNAVGAIQAGIIPYEYRGSWPPKAHRE